jgi:hypothetical protein
MVLRTLALAGKPFHAAAMTYAIEAAIRRQALACAPNRSLSPEDIARAVSPDNWHSLLSAVRAAAITLAKSGEIEILRKGKKVDPAGEIKGVIRLRRHAATPASSENSSSAGNF